MVFMPDKVPATSLDTGTDYIADAPFDAKQSRITSRRHRWFQPIPIATNTGLYTMTPGLTAGLKQRFQFDHKPDWIVVSISGRTDANGRCNVFLGDEGGFAIGPCGAGAKISVPAPEGGIITVVNIGSTTTYGMVTAVGGYTDLGVDITLGS